MWALLFILLSFPISTDAHEKHHAKPLPMENKGEAISPHEGNQVWTTINNRYQKEIRPIFQRACFNCHSSETEYPWYYHVPGIKQFIDHDIREAKEHIDMSDNFPFKGHGNPEEDLEGIKQTILKNTMPPSYYMILHWESKLTEEEKQKIIRWIEESTKLR